MPDKPNREDDQWLSALAGKPDPEANPLLNQEAAAVRMAMKKHADAIDSQIPDTNDRLYQQLLFRLRREGLLEKEKARKPFINTNSWGIAASVLLGTVLALQNVYFFGQSKETDMSPEFTVRGDLDTTIMASSPKEKSQELAEGLKAAGGTPKVTKLPDGSIRIDVQSTDKVIDFLIEERIPPKEKKTITLVIKPTTK